MLGWVTHKQQQGKRTNQNLCCMAVITGYYEVGGDREDNHTLAHTR